MGSGNRNQSYPGRGMFQGLPEASAYTAPAGPIAPLDILYGHRASMARGNLFMAHRCGFTQKVLTGTLQAHQRKGDRFIFHLKAGPMCGRVRSCQEKPLS
jgi:hypothetical protein